MKRLLDKFKSFYDNTYGMLITVSWVVLIICLIIKLLGGNWFELGTDNERFIAFCEYVDTNLVLKRILACSIYLLTTLPILCILLNERKLKPRSCAIFIPLMICKSIISWYILAISYILDVVIIILLPLILCKFKNWKVVIFGNLLVFAFQLLLIVVRNLSGGLNGYETFIQQAIIQVDYYIMILLFYLYYFRNKEKK